MNKKQKRNRGIILTIKGWQKFQDARVEHELRDNRGYKFTLEELGACAGLTTATLRKILTRDRGVDKSSVVTLFAALSLELDSDDYTSPKSIETPDNNKRTQKKVDWGEAIDVSAFYGRRSELATLDEWLLQDSCRLITIVGIGGIGKTALSVKLAEQVKDKYDYVIWRSLRDIPSIQDILTNLIQFLGGEQVAKAELPESTNEKISLLVECMRSSRCLIIFDNVESLFYDSSRAGICDEEYEEYDRLFQRVGESKHQSCLLLTTREKPKQVAIIEGESMPVRTLQLSGIKAEESEKILKAKGLFASKSELAELVTHYGGNALALKIVATTIRDLFRGDVAEFLHQDTAIFGDVRDLLDQQFNRLLAIEAKIMYWLAINREPITLVQIQEDLVGSVSSFELLEGLESLSRRCLIDKAENKTTESNVSFTLQSVVMEYVTSRLIDNVCHEIVSNEIELFRFHALMKATAKDYIKNTQFRLILQPLIKKLLTVLKGKRNLENRLKQIIKMLQETSPLEPGYTAGNIINLFCQMETSLTGYDFSNLCVWQANLRNACLHDVNFQNADLAKSVFTETFGGVLSVAFSPDGKSLATGDTNGEIHLRRMSDGQPILTFQGHSSWVVSVTFSPDGTVLASGSSDYTVKLWDVETGQCLQIFQGHDNEVWSVAFSPDGTVLASGSDDQTVKLWSISTGECLKTFQGHTSWVHSVDFSLNGQTLASGSDDQTVKLWDISTSECLKTLQGHYNEIYSVAFNSQGDLLASGSHDQTVKLWDISTGECLKTLQGHSSWVYSVAFNPQGNFIVSGSYDQTVRLWNVHTNQCLRTFQGYTNQVLSVVFSPDGQTLASGSQDSSVRLWNVSTSQALKTFQGHSAAVWSIAFSPDGQTLISSSEDRTIRLWDVAEGRCLKIFQGHRALVWSVTFSPDGQTLISSSEDRTIRLWDVKTGQVLRILQEHSAAVWSVAFSPDGQTLASGSHDQTVKLWDISTGKCLKTLQGHSSWVWSVAFSPDGKLLVSTSPDGTIRLWSVDTNECLKVLKVNIGWLQLAAFSPDSRILACSNQDFKVELWDISTGKCLKTLADHTGRVWSITFDPYSRTLASSGEDETIRLWDLKTGNCLKTMKAEKPYKHMNIKGFTGLSPATVATLKLLGAVDDL